METIIIDGKEISVYTTQDIANMTGCSIRTVQLRCDKFYGKLGSGKKRILSEDQKIEICASIKSKE